MRATPKASKAQRIRHSNLLGRLILTIDDPGLPGGGGGAPPAPPAPPPPPPPPAPAPTAAPAPAPTSAPAPAPTAAPAAAPAPTAAPAPAGAPQEYADFTMPAGVKADAEVLTEFKTLAKQHNLTQEAAQQVIDLQTKVAQRQSDAINQHLKTYWDPVGGLPETWAALSKADKEFGGEKYDENMAAVAAARDRFGTPLLEQVLARTGAGNHPEVVRFFLRVSKAISEDGFVAGRGSGSKSDADVFYAKPS